MSMEFKTTEQPGCYNLKIMAEENGLVMGWAILCIIANDRHAEPYALLENVYVEQEHRGQGIGKQLINRMIEESRARGCYKLLATSRHTKPEVHVLYEKFGFKNWGVEFRMDLIDSKPQQRD